MHIITEQYLVREWNILKNHCKGNRIVMNKCYIMRLIDYAIMKTEEVKRLKVQLKEATYDGVAGD